MKVYSIALMAALLAVDVQAIHHKSHRQATVSYVQEDPVVAEQAAVPAELSAKVAKPAEVAAIKSDEVAKKAPANPAPKE